MKSIERSEPSDGTLLPLAAGLSLIAGVVHLLVSPESLGQWWGYGFFFMVAALGQLAYGLALFLLPWLSGDADGFFQGTLPGVSALYTWGVVGNAAIVALWVVTRTVGIPVGPQTGSVEPLDAISITATVVELALIGALALLARHSAAQLRSKQ